MESIIRWKTGTPTRDGRYLIVVGNNTITCDHWSYDSFQGKMEWVVYKNDEIKYGVGLKVLSSIIKLKNMAKLAIKGHSSRGDEVIEILKMLGANNKYHINIAEWNLLYTMREGDNVIIATYPTGSILQIFTLEEFLEKYPYKVGDTVIAYAEGCIAQFTIQDMRWNYELNKVEYKICSSWCDTSLMQPYKEETMEERKYTDLRLDVDQDDKLATEATIDGDKITPPENYLIGKITKLDDGMLVEFVKKQPKYPKTYIECAKILNCFSAAHIDGYKNELIEKLQELLVCRDAYWKISGDWKPNFANQEKKFVIANYYGELYTYKAFNRNRVLVFPTEEMRDAFYENFKDLIEECKELL